MATTVAVLEAALHADTKKFDAAMGKSESKMQKLGKVAGVAGLAIAAGLAVAFKVGFDEASEMLKVTAQTEAVLKSTGSAANVTAGHVRDLAEEISSYSGMDDEAVQAGENLLLTFHKIQNLAGQNNDIFDQATRITADLAQAMGMDMSAAALQVGKALNDPIKGMSRLGRIGVSFTKAQEKTIKRLVETGDVAGAQKVILAELTKEFGGSAKAFGDTMPGKLKIAQESFRNLAGELVIALIPAIEAVAEHLSRFAAFLRDHPGLVKVLVIGLAALAGALIAASVAATLMNLALLANPIGLVVIAVVALIALLVVLYMKFEFVRRIVGFVREHWMLLLLAFGLLPFIIAKIVQHFGTLRAIAMPVLNAIRGAFEAVRQKAMQLKDWIVGTLWPAVKPKLVTIKDAVMDIADAFQSIISKVQLLIGWVGDLISKIGDIPSPGDIANKVLPGNPFPGDAAGTSNRRAGWGWVGERGPELVNLPQGSRVYSNGVSSAMAGGGGGGTTIILNVPSSALVVDAGKLVRYLDDARRTYGRRGGA